MSLGGQGEGGNVLEVGGVEGGEDLGRIDDGADVGAVQAGAAESGVAELIHQVGGGSVGQLGHEGLGVGVVEDHALGVLGQAGRLLVGGLVKALLFELDAEGAGGEFGLLLQGLGVGLAGGADLGEVGFKAHAVPACRLQVLGGANEGAGTVVDGFAEGAEVAAGFRRRKMRACWASLGTSDEDAFFAGGAGPGFDAGEPVERRGIGGAAEESDDQNEMSGLAFGEIGVNPESITGEEIGHLADGQGEVASFDVDIDFWTGQIKGRAIGKKGNRETKEPQKQQRQTSTHGSILREWERGASREGNEFKY